jgi:cellulose synthase/poly-beta-1,6-N-acetylglucosamine synthase-like glycosyltransferase
VNGPDAIAIVDADSHADSGFLEALVRPFARGAPAVQGESLLIDDGTPAASFRAAAFLLVNRVRPSGRAVLGLPCHLAGNGILLATAVLRTTPWDAFTSAEDLEYSLELRMRGIGPTFAGGAILHSPAAPNPAAAAEQQLRWEGGKLHLARTWLPKLLATAVRERRPLLLDAAFDLAVPPLGLLTAAATAGAAAAITLEATDVISAWPLLPWLVAVAAIPLYVAVGLRAAHAPASAYRAVVRAPMYVALKLGRLGRAYRFRGDTWVRTERADPRKGHEDE